MRVSLGGATLLNRYSLALCVLGFGACGKHAQQGSRPSASPTDSHSDTLSVLRGRIRGVGLDMTEPQVLGILGRPVSIGAPNYSEMIADTIREWRYSGLQVSFYGHHVQSLVCDTSCSTPDGVDIGATRQAVLVNYGVQSPGYDQVPDYLAYTLGHTDCWLGFEFTNDRVRRIVVQCDYA
jgi:hypothetical protein